MCGLMLLPTTSPRLATPIWNLVRTLTSFGLLPSMSWGKTFCDFMPCIGLPCSWQRIFHYQSVSSLMDGGQRMERRFRNRLGMSLILSSWSTRYVFDEPRAACDFVLLRVASSDLTTVVLVLLPHNATSLVSIRLAFSSRPRLTLETTVTFPTRQ